MLLKLLIVDDEIVIRQGLRHAISWEKHGICVIGEAENGEDALRKAAHLLPDIIITDIKMPQLDGIGFVRRLKTELPDCHIIYLSGYSKTDYMLEAIRNGVCDYLLKPAGSEEILAAVLKIRDKLLDQLTRQEQLRVRDHLATQNLSILQTHFIDSLLSGSVPDDRITENARALQIPLTGPLFQLLTASVKKDSEWNAIQCLTVNLEGLRCGVYPLPDCGLIVVILHTGAPVRDEQLAELGRGCDSWLDPRCPMVLSQSCDHPGKLAACYGRTQDCFARAHWFRGDPILQAPPEPFPAYEPVRYGGMLQELSRLLQSKSFSPIGAVLASLFEQMEQDLLDQTHFLHLVHQITYSIQSATNRWSALLKLEELLAGPFRPAQILAFLSGMLGDTAHACVSLQYDGQIANVLQYIEQNFSREISLTDAANALYISPSYLSRLVKEKTGSTFHEWVNLLRVEKAKELLKNPEIKTYEIANSVGYSSYKIFAENFQRIMSCSAREYRARLLQNQST